MDTDSLSRETYDGVIRSAESFSHNLTLHFGVLARGCDNEEDYLNQALELVDEYRQAEEDEYEEIFFGETPDKQALHQILEKIRTNIFAVQGIPLDRRHLE